MTARRRRPVRATIVLAAAALGAGATPAAAKLVEFRTPSGNISCIGETVGRDNSVRCDIRVRDWSPPPRPRGCTLDWGAGLSLGRTGRATYVCAGDTAFNRGPKLAYGASRRLGAIICTSRRSGLRCVNAAGHGFVLSRQRVVRF